MPKTNAWSSVIRGCAIGDSWGNLLEFPRYKHICQDYGYRGPEFSDALVKEVAQVTDDTQMTLHLARALNHAAGLPMEELRAKIISGWVEWLDDPDNYRAPGKTCLDAARRLHTGTPWQHALVPRSDGSGAVMRVWPAAFLPDDLWREVSAWQAASTHGGTNAVFASIAGACLARYGYERGMALPTLGEICRASLDSFDTRWLYGLHEMSSADDVLTFLKTGAEGLLDAVNRARPQLEEFRNDPWDDDVCAPVPGWRSHDTLAAATLCLDLFPDDPYSAVRRATVSEGDSDTVAAVTGALAGRMHPFPWDGLPENWFSLLEPRYQQWIIESDDYVFTDTDGAP